MLRACVRHLRAELLQGSRTGRDGVLLDILDVAMALRLGIRAPPVLTGPVPPSSATSTPFHLPIEGRRTANGEFSSLTVCSVAGMGMGPVIGLRLLFMQQQTQIRHFSDGPTAMSGSDFIFLHGIQATYT